MNKLITAFGLGVLVAGLAAYAFLSKPVPAPVIVVHAPAAPAVDAVSTGGALPAPAEPEPRASASDRKAAARTKPTPTAKPAPTNTETDPTQSHPAPEPATQATVEVPTAPPVVAPAPPVPAPAPPVPAPTPAVPAPVPPVAAKAETPAPAPPAVAPPPKTPRTALIPAGTLITVRLSEALSSNRNETDYNFRATLDHPLVVQNMVVAERGSLQMGRVVAVDKGGRGPKSHSSLSLELTQLTTADGQKVAIQTETFVHQGDSSAGWHEAAKVGAGAAIGAAIGAIVGGGKGAGIGAAAGGVAGTGAVLMTKSSEAKLPEETRISFRLKEPITLTEKLD